MMMRDAIAARSLGVFERYVDEMFRNMWTEPKKMDDPAIFRTALTGADFDASRFFRADRDPRDQGRTNKEH
jgi:2-hydroxychromene-2-carboxylate isomerase